MLKFNVIDEDLPNEGNGGNIEPNPESETQTETSESNENIAVFGNLKVDLSTPEGREAAVKAYNNAVKLGQTKSAELAKLTKGSKENETNTKKESEDKRLELVYRKTVDSEFDKFVDTQKQTLASKYGDKYNEVKDIFEKNVSKSAKGLNTEQKLELAQKGTLDILFKQTYADFLLNGNKQNKTVKTDPLVNKEEQESLPNIPKPNESDVNKSIIPETPGVDHGFKKTAEQARAARLSRANEGLSK